MKKSCILLILLAILIVIGATLSVSAANIDGLNTTSDVDDAFELAKLENKNIVLIFDQSSCVYCDLLKQNTLSDGDVQKQLNDKFITVIVDVNENYDLADKYGVFGTPTVMIINSTGDEISKIEGYVEADEFLNILKES